MGRSQVQSQSLGPLRGTVCLQTTKLWSALVFQDPSEVFGFQKTLQETALTPGVLKTEFLVTDPHSTLVLPLLLLPSPLPSTCFGYEISMRHLTLQFGFQKSTRSNFQLQFLNQLQLDRCNSSSGLFMYPRITHHRQFHLYNLAYVLFSADLNHPFLLMQLATLNPTAPLISGSNNLLSFKQTLSSLRAGTVPSASLTALHTVLGMWQGLSEGLGCPKCIYFHPF